MRPLSGVGSRKSSSGALGGSKLRNWRYAALEQTRNSGQDSDAAELRNRCRRAGVQIGTIDAVLAHLCLRHRLTLLITDDDFMLVAAHCPLRVWGTAS